MMMNDTNKRHHFDTVVIGGQAELVAGYYLARQNQNFVILDAHISRQKPLLHFYVAIDST